MEIVETRSLLSCLPPTTSKTNRTLLQQRKERSIPPHRVCKEQNAAGRRAPGDPHTSHVQEMALGNGSVCSPSSDSGQLIQGACKAAGLPFISNWEKLPGFPKPTPLSASNGDSSVARRRVQRLSEGKTPSCLAREKAELPCTSPRVLQLI